MIEVKDLVKSYGALLALDRVSFEVQAGQVVGFLGPNGAGKTTTLRILTGYMPGDGGHARIAGHDVFSESQQVRRRIGYLPESTPLYNDMRVREYLRFRARLKGVPGAALAERIARVAGMCWLEDFVNRPIGQLSKGMRQRVGLADALVHEPEILFLDEPTIGLDPTQIRKTRELIAELGRRHTVLLSSHILSDVEAVCSQVVIINHGRVVAQGAPRELSERIGSSSRIIAEIRGPRAEITAGIQGLSGVRGVEDRDSQGWSRLSIESDPQADVRQAIASLAAGRGWDLRELRREVASLEDYFIKIVARQNGEA